MNTYSNTALGKPTLTYESFFQNFASKAKQDILQSLQGGARNVKSIAATTGQEQSAVSHNLRKLATCNIVTVKQEGKERYYQLNEATVKPILALAAEHVVHHCPSECAKKCPGCSTREVNT